jgi:hypothetical protein
LGEVAQRLARIERGKQSEFFFAQQLELDGVLLPMYGQPKRFGFGVPTRRALHRLPATLALFVLEALSSDFGVLQ